jgi:hypothetical protein
MVFVWFEVHLCSISKNGLSLQYIICTSTNNRKWVDIDKLSKSFFSTHFYNSNKVPKHLFFEEYISFKIFRYLRRRGVILLKVLVVIFAPSHPKYG